MLYTKPQIITCNRKIFIFISTFSFIKNVHIYLKKIQTLRTGRHVIIKSSDAKG